MPFTPRVVFDFDGVIHLYDGKWQGAEVITGGLVPGIDKAIAHIRAAGYHVVVVSARCHSSNGPQGAEAIRKWLDAHGVEVDDIAHEKPPALVYIDDRAICFDGDANGLLEKVRSFQPWTKKPGGIQACET